MPPIDPVTTLDTAAQWGFASFIAVLIFIVLIGIVFWLMKMVIEAFRTNTEVVGDFKHVVSKMCDDLGEHDTHAREVGLAAVGIADDVKDVKRDTTDIKTGLGRLLDRG